MDTAIAWTIGLPQRLAYVHNFLQPMQHGQQVFVDKGAAHEQELIEAATQRIERFGLTVEMVGAAAPTGSDSDRQMLLRWQGGEVRYRVETKRGLRPASLGVIAHQIRCRGPDTLLVADHVSPPLAERLRALGLQFVDAAGNAFLNHPPLLVWVKGERPLEPLTAPAAGRAFQASGLRVLFALLAVSGLAREPYRVIAQRAGVAHGTVGCVMAELPQLGFLAEIGGQRRLLQPERLLRQWVEAFARTLRPKLVLQTLRSPMIDWWRELDPREFGLVLGGEAAAARLTGMIEPEMLTLYGAKADMKRFILRRPLRTDPRGNVEILQQFWHFDPDPPELAPTLLIYADLLATGDARCLEAARALEGGILDRLAG